MKKKIIILSLCSFLLLGIVGCNKKSEQNNQESQNSGNNLTEKNKLSCSGISIVKAILFVPVGEEESIKESLSNPSKYEITFDKDTKELKEITYKEDIDKNSLINFSKDANIGTCKANAKNEEESKKCEEDIDLNEIKEQFQDTCSKINELSKDTDNKITISKCTENSKEINLEISIKIDNFSQDEKDKIFNSLENLEKELKIDLNLSNRENKIITIDDITKIIPKVNEKLTEIDPQLTEAFTCK